MVSTPFGRGPSRISSAAYTGRAVPPAQPDPVTTGLITRNSLQLGVVANQIQGLTAQMQSLTGSLQVIGGSLRQQQTLLAQKEQTEQDLENRLAQQKLREGKESVIEKKIQASALAPAAKIASKAQFSLGRLGNYFLALLGGWLLSASVELLKKYGSDIKTKFNQIKEFSINAFSIVSGIVSTITDTIVNVGDALSRLGTKIRELATTGIFSDLVGQLTEFATNAGKDILNAVGGKVGYTPFPERKAEQEAEQKSSEGEEGAETPPPGTQPSKNVFSDLFEKGMDFFGGGSPFSMFTSEEDLDGIGGPSMSPLASSMYSISEDTSASFDMGFGAIDLNQPMGSEKAEITAQPQETMMGEPVQKSDASEAPVDPETTAQFGEGTLQVQEGDPQAKESDVSPKGDASKNLQPGQTSPADIPLEGDASKNLQPGQISPGDTTLSEMGFTVSEVQNYIDTEKYIGMTGNLPSSSLPTLKFDATKKSTEVAQKLATPPEEPGVTVLPMPMDSGDSGGQQQAPAGVAGGAIAATPAYATFNPDISMFYGATSHFNVIG